MKFWNLLFVSVFSLILAIGCSNDDSEQISDQTASPQEVQYPTATGEWREARTFIMRSDAGSSDQECDQSDFRVMANSGIFSLNRCANTRSGQLTPDEFRQLDSLTTAAYTQTQSNFCPEIFRFNKYYATIDSQNDEYDRNFDPDDACFSGSDNAVENYKEYLLQLLNKYQGNTTSS